MIKDGMTIKEAAERWVSEMNEYPQDMIEMLMSAKPDDWREVTLPRIGDRVYVTDLPDGCEEYELDGEIENFTDDLYLINLYDGNTVEVGVDDFEAERDSYLPMWGWLWSFGDSVDDYFLEDLDGIKKMSESGFRIYENEEWGYFFGIDGCGYSFYEEHWIPLYKARGLHWHDERTEHTDDDVRKMLVDYGVTDAAIDEVMKIEKRETKGIGGYYGGYISSDDAKKISMCNHFSIEEHHEKVQEMSHLEDNDYYLIERLI